MNKVICTTSIYPPSEALRKFAAMEGWKLVIAGDKRTPHESYIELENLYAGRFFYLHPNHQEKYDRALSDAIGWNCIQRRNFSFLYACKELKADILASVDDDNIPLDGWGENVLVGNNAEIFFHTWDISAFDPLYASTGGCTPWHRGFPIQLVYQRGENSPNIKAEFDNVDVQADLWLGDLDIDAICRAVGEFNNWDLSDFEDYFPFASNKPSPFNSQNTFLARHVMPDYFMFPGISRMDDIWAGFHIQACGHRVVYNKPSVRQSRNPHDIANDLIGEALGYQHNLEIVNRINKGMRNAVTDFAHLPERAKEALRLYQKHFE